MPYQPDLIPKEHRVLPNYFNIKNFDDKPGGKAPGPEFHTIIAVLFFIMALVFFKYPVIGLLMAVSGLICTPKGQRVLEKKLRFRMTTKIRTIFCGSLLVCCLPLFPYYVAQDAENERLAVLAEKKMEGLRADSLRRDAIRKDSLQLWLTKSKSAPPAESLADLKVATRFVILSDERNALDTQIRVSTFRLIKQMIQSGKYRQGLATVQRYLTGHSATPELWYCRAQCYIRLDSMRLAVDDLDSARSRGYKPAGKLYEIVNPLRRHVAYHTTLCNDGTTSEATGRGACSWHGGVAEWNHPVYETSRKY